ncbi:MAG: YraN family protein [Candidatus Niyogibacteria bacterium]|nr:YraN family protein [Candidatus Niyogibacteria bacterium]
MFSRETSRQSSLDKSRDKSGQEKQKTAKRKLGDLGERIFVKHLVKHRYEILDRNYQKKWGEIDVVAKKDDVIHFFEVKTMKLGFEKLESGDYYNPEENVHYYKQKRLARAIQIYLVQKKIPENQECQVDVAAVFLDFRRRRARIRITQDIDLA